ARNDASGLKKLFIMGTKASILTSFTLGFFLFCSSEVLYSLWLGPGHELSAAIMRILVVIWTMASLNTVGCGIFWGQEPPKWHGFTQLVFVIVSFVSGWFFIGRFGVMGAVYAFALAWFVSFTLLGVKLLKVSGVSFVEFIRDVLWLPSAMLVAAYVIFLMAGPLGYLFSVISATSFFAVSNWLLYLSEDEKNRYKSIIKFSDR
ncbi:MAG: hypothetical protein QME32_04930, partial [Endomicrobiia bacterium]|nr:hypothetical protein [Endomicrobiia bacterium]